MLLNMKGASSMIFAVYKIKKIMKKLIIVIAIAMSFASCQKESTFIEVEILNISANDNQSTVVYKVMNNSDFDISCTIKFDIDGTDLQKWESDCKIYPANSRIILDFNSTGFVYSVDYKVKICEI